ncbi:MAG: MBL fold metallo-hydrolase [Clostridia bacterium]|nr:MBL fold metallo-hydrolase [Clostridia bacterium]
MIIKVLSENTTSSENLGCEHGLSIYIETRNHKLLFDTGASALFSENAKKMGVDLASVDLTVISHGHYDHGGGLPAFLGMNDKSFVYVNENAFGKYYARRLSGKIEYIGLPEGLDTESRFVFCGDDYIIDDELELFSGVRGERLVPSGNGTLLMQRGDDLLQDDFTHEQNLIITENGQTVLVAGCAHAGIVNIVEHFRSKKGFLPDIVIGGFHLYNHGLKKSEDPEIVDEIGEILLGTGSYYYTCHCTGKEAYDRLKSVMGDKADYLATGDQLNTINIRR